MTASAAAASGNGAHLASVSALSGLMEAIPMSTATRDYFRAGTDRPSSTVSVLWGLRDAQACLHALLAQTAASETPAPSEPARPAATVHDGWQQRLERHLHAAHQAVAHVAQEASLREQLALANARVVPLAAEAARTSTAAEAARRQLAEAERAAERAQLASDAAAAEVQSLTTQITTLVHELSVPPHNGSTPSAAAAAASMVCFSDRASVAAPPATWTSACARVHVAGVGASSAKAADGVMVSPLFVASTDSTSAAPASVHAIDLKEVPIDASSSLGAFEPKPMETSSPAVSQELVDGSVPVALAVLCEGPQIASVPLQAVAASAGAVPEINFARFGSEGDRVSRASPLPRAPAGLLSLSTAAASSTHVLPTSGSARVGNDDARYFPTDDFPCRSLPRCRPAVEGQLELCCFVGVQKKGIGHQLLVHYKGFPASFNTWWSAKRLRAAYGPLVDVYIHQQLATASTASPRRKGLLHAAESTAAPAVPAVPAAGAAPNIPAAIASKEPSLLSAQPVVPTAVAAGAEAMTTIAVQLQAEQSQGLVTAAEEQARAAEAELRALGDRIRDDASPLPEAGGGAGAASEAATAAAAPMELDAPPARAAVAKHQRAASSSADHGAAAAAAAAPSSAASATVSDSGGGDDDDDDDDDDDVEDVTKQRFVAASMTQLSAPQSVAPKHQLGSSGWNLQLDGPADSFPCGGDASTCQRSAESLANGCHEVCSYVAVRAVGRGHQVRVHYKGYPAKFNEWRAAKELAGDEERVEAFIQARMGDRSVTSPNATPRKRGSAAVASAEDDASGTAGDFASSATMKKARTSSAVAAAAPAAAAGSAAPGPLSARGNRSLEDLEVDKLLELVCKSQSPAPVVARSLAASTVDRWVGIHFDELQRHLQAQPPPVALVSSLHLRWGEEAEEAEHWVLLLIHTGSKEVVLVDPLPQEEELRVADDALASLRAQLENRCLAGYSWRCCYLGVQKDTFNCGVWMAVIWREWLKKAATTCGLEAIVPGFCSRIRIKHERQVCCDMLDAADK